MPEQALKSFKLLLICKIMMNAMDDVNALLNGKYAIKYAGPAIEAMNAIFKAYHDKNLSSFALALS
jgi:26S proteasome regulatory subunit N6